MKLEITFIITAFALALTSGETKGNPLAAPDSPQPGANSTAGRALFLKNCAHCHGADARGDEGPDLHNLDSTDEWIANRIQNGKKGQMTAFAGKLQRDEINAVVAYLRTLK